MNNRPKRFTAEGRWHTTDETAQRLVAAADDLGVSVACVIRWSVGDWLDKHYPAATPGEGTPRVFETRTEDAA